MLFGIVYPCAAGLDAGRQTLYLTLCALVFLAFTAWRLVTLIQQNRAGQNSQPLEASQTA
jgi:hypothetical protein